MSEQVYFLKGETSGAIKIGRSSNAARRLATLQTASAEPTILLGVTDGGKDLEDALHKEFAAIRQRGEWFAATPELLARVAALCANTEVARATPMKTDDAYTLMAQLWLGQIEANITEQTGRSLSEVRKHLPAALHCQPGFLENLRRGRIDAIAVREYEAIRKMAIASGESRIADLHEQIKTIAGTSSVLGHDRGRR